LLPTADEVKVYIARAVIPLPPEISNCPTLVLAEPNAIVVKANPLTAYEEPVTEIPVGGTLAVTGKTICVEPIVEDEPPLAHPIISDPDEDS
jgi:hypothetical protein